MFESSTRQAVLAQAHAEVLAHACAAAHAEGKAAGALIEARRMLLMLGSQLLGKPKKAVKQRIAGMSQLQSIERLFVRVPKAGSWQELLTHELKTQSNEGKHDSKSGGRSSRRPE